MAFQYASYAIPQAPPSSLADFMPQFEAGQQKRLDLDAAKAAASLGQGPYQQQAQSLAALDPNAGRPQFNPQNPPTVGDRASELDAYTGSVGQRESSGNPNAVNPTSGATGLYQFLPSTWQDLMQRHPDLGLTPEGIKDPAQQQRAMQVFTAENAKQLAASGIRPDPTSLYAAHLLGGGGASKVLSQPDNTPLSAVVDPAALQANPQIAGLNVGQFKQWVSQQGPQGQGGGYAPPMAQPQGDGGQPGPAMGLPSRETMLALFRSPETRPLAIEMIKAVQAGQSPAALLDMAYKRAQIAQVGLPDGYQRTADGGMQAAPGGPADPNNPLNAMKVGMMGGIASGNVQVGFGPNGAPDPGQQAQFLQALPSSVASDIKGLTDYSIDPTKAFSMRGNQRQQMIQLAKEYDPTYDMSQYPARAAMRKSVTSGSISQNILAANTAIQHLGELNDIVDKLPNTGFSALNAITNAGQSQFGSEEHKQALATFQQTATAAQDELAKLFKGAGASDIKTIEDWGKGLDVNADPQVLHATINNAIANLLKARLDTIDSQYQQVMGKPADFEILKPAAIAALKKMGIDPTALDPSAAQAIDATQAAPDASAQPQQAAQPPAGPTATNPQTGEKLALQNGQWVRVK